MLPVPPSALPCLVVVVVVVVVVPSPTVSRETWQAQQKASGTDSEATVVASAPGKVILFGEHAVVYGKTAVGAAVSDLRIVTTVVSSCRRFTPCERKVMQGQDATVAACWDVVRVPWSSWRERVGFAACAAAGCDRVVGDVLLEHLLLLSWCAYRCYSSTGALGVRRVSRVDRALKASQAP